MDEKLRGDEGYKDGCWTPIREGLSLVRLQSGVREEGEINTRQYQGETLLSVAVTAHLGDACLLSWEYL